MKFADKYELSDAVTSGRLETFLGRDVASGQRVLVHIFDAPVKQPGQPTVLWALESFRAIAPEAPGLVIAAGRYEATSFAYLVTQVPENGTLRQWTQAYESSTAETREIPVERVMAEKDPAGAPSRPNAEAVVSASLDRPSNPPTGFFGLRPPVEADAKPAPAAAEPAGSSSEAAVIALDGINFGPRQNSPGREPEDFTKEFFVGSSEPRKTPTVPVTPVPVETIPIEPPPTARRNDRIEAADSTSSGKSANPDAGLPELGGFTALFSPGPKAEMPQIKSVLSGNDSIRQAEDVRAGDFTKFFQRPFDGERPAEVPIVSPNVTNAPRGKVPGEFTQMFGAVKDSPSASPSTSPPADPPLQTKPGSFTRSFSNAGHISSTSLPPSPGAETKGSGNQKATAFVEPNWTQAAPPPLVVPANPPELIVPRASVDKPRESRPSIQGGATQLFSVPGAHPAPSLHSAPSGPSEYTRIISGGIAGLNSSAEQPVAEEVPAAGLPTFKMSAAAAPLPKIATPAAPKLPKMPPAPKVSVGALLHKPKSSYLPMIIILNVSLIVAVLLIVYFAIKH